MFNRNEKELCRLLLSRVDPSQGTSSYHITASIWEPGIIYCVSMKTCGCGPNVVTVQLTCRCDVITHILSLINYCKTITKNSHL